MVRVAPTREQTAVQGWSKPIYPFRSEAYESVRGALSLARVTEATVSSSPCNKETDGSQASISLARDPVSAIW